MSDAYTRLIQQMLASGQEMARAFNPALETFNPKSFEKMIPTMPAEMLEMWWGKTFNREGLDARTRLLVTLAGLIAQGAVAEPQIRLTVRHARTAGAGRREIAETIFQSAMFGGLPAMQKGLELAQAVFDEEPEEGTQE
ncbi:carboxymuconolactone decarboxylase family protein [Paracoccus sp. S-4012]|uniref:carboxymuconolactone decarboxylase family protein n=1 Tax=Paracoccus sp. S-4012 TaxID=2665648 RepID=UPI0012B0F910|nr:carboxymuconolactone decarboxylase family protein [Paracoccus sp. S-4012]MRX50589.1 carboxymuconolactone decarboxylase family protein [Paracoccus sp. S-4012]